MKIFPADSKPARAKVSAETNTPEGNGKITRKKASGPAKKDISASDIKEKLAAHSQKSDVAKDVVISKNAKRMGDGFMNPDVVNVQKPEIVPIIEKSEEEEIKTPNTKDLTIKSDIALNDPKDTNTQEKLKAALTRGAFSFSAKEREALEKILGN